MTPEINPLISVIVPVYNVETHIAACIASLRAQDFDDFEAIIIDDGATDNSVSVALDAIDDDPRFKVIRQENGGLSAARNTGLDHARGQYIAFVDSDDTVTPDYLSTLHQALDGSTADWAACAIRSVYPDGRSSVHSAIHSAPEPDPDPAPRIWPMTSWAQVIDHFPSAWNKLYRAALIDGLRFDEGTLYEDHAFFHQAARRTQSIIHVPLPLYRQTRARPGQITTEDSDRVFDQIRVLQRLSGLMNTDKAGPVPAFATLASRLLFERASIIRTPERRQRFLDAAQDFLDTHSLRYMPDWSTGIGPSLGLELAGQIPLSIVIPWVGGDGLAETLGSIAQGESCGAEVIVACDRVSPDKAQDVISGVPDLHDARVIASPGTGAGAARNAGLENARGAYIVFLDAGDVLAPWAALHEVGGMLHHGADLGLVPFRIGLEPDALIHQGFHNNRGLPPPPVRAELLEMTPDIAAGMYCQPSAKVFDRAFLLAYGLQFGEGPLSDWRMGVHAALCAKRTLRFASAGVAVSQAPEHRRLWRRPDPVRVLAHAIAEIGITLPSSARMALPEGWQHRLLGRALWEKLGFAPMTRAGRLGYWLAATREVAALDPLPDGALIDPYLGDRLTALISCAGRSRFHCIMRALGR